MVLKLDEYGKTCFVILVKSSNDVKMVDIFKITWYIKDILTKKGVRKTGRCE